MSSVFSKRGSITRVLLTTYFLKHAELIQLMGVSKAKLLAGGASLALSYSLRRCAKC